MRQIKLTDEQVELLQKALGMAENQLSKLHNEIISQTVLVRGVDSPTAKTKEKMWLFDESTHMADLNYSLSNGELDV